MRLALINKRFAAGGGENQAAGLAKEFCRRGHAVHLYGNDFAGAPKEAAQHFVPLVKKPGWARIFSFAYYCQRALARAPAYDAVYAITQAGPADAYYLGGGAYRQELAERDPQRCRRWARHLANPTRLAQIHAEDKIMRRPGALLVANSTVTRDNVSRFYPEARGRLRVIKNGTDHEIFNPGNCAARRDAARQAFDLRAGDLAICYIAHNWRRKNLKTLLGALALLAAPQVKLLVVGKDKQREYRQLARELALASGQVKFCGPLSEPLAVYAAADALVLPTLSDPCSRVALEALACGLPTITTAANGAAEQIIPQVSGYVQQDPTDHLELASLLRNLLHQPTLQKLRQGARKNPARSFVAVATETLQLLEEIAERKRQNGGG